MKRKVGLDLLRVVAIFMVLLRHCFAGYEDGLDSDSLWIDWFLVFSLNGWAGVDLFFVLSGYLIASQWDSSITSIGGLYRYSVQFWIRRGIRILPLYVFVLAVVFCCRLAVGEEVKFGQVAVYLLSLQDYFGSPWLVPLWSLAVEIKFYIVAPALLFLCAKAGRASPLVIFIIVIFSFFSRYVAAESEVGVRYEDYFWGVRSPFHQALDGLMLGVAIALLQKRYQPGIITSYVYRVLFGVNGLVLIWILSSTLYMCDGCSVSSAKAVGLVSLLFAAQVALAVFMPPFQFSDYANRVLKMAADLSYGVYLIHMAFIAVGAQVAGLFFPSGSLLASTVVFFVVAVLSFVGAWLLHILLERPTFKLRAKLQRVV